MGAVAMAQGQYEAARAHFSAAGTHDPNNVSAMLNEAIVLTSKLGQHKEAMAKCVRALQLDDANPKIYHLLGNHHHPYPWWRPYPTIVILTCTKTIVTVTVTSCTHMHDPTPPLLSPHYTASTTR
jgi:tetratricopeptide (TPR) repeat protein